MNEYEGKKAVVTGGTHGMGRAMVEMLLGGGAEVLLTGRDGKNLETARIKLGPGRTWCAPTPPACPTSTPCATRSGRS